MLDKNDSSENIVAQVSKYLEKIGAVPKRDQKSKKGWILDGEIINLEPAKNPNWFAFNKLKKLENNSLWVRWFRKNFGLSEDDILHSGNSGKARIAIWINCSVGGETLIRIIDWMQDQKI
jgi:hypothetical protein